MFDIYKCKLDTYKCKLNTYKCWLVDPSEGSTKIMLSYELINTNNV
jgi:hypothetical protein